MPLGKPELNGLSVAVNVIITNMPPNADSPQVDRRQPLYKSLIAAMRQRIESGELAPGAKAPSESDLIAEFRVSSTTARRCLDELERLHLVRRVQGKGTFVTSENPLTAQRQVGILYNELFSLAEGISSHIFRGVGSVLDASERQAMLLAAGALRRSPQPGSALFQMMRQHQLEALLVMSPLPLPWLKEVLDDGIPVASVNFAYSDPRIYAAAMDAPGAMRRISKSLADAGHRDVVLVRGTFPTELLDGVILNHWELSDLRDINCRVETFPYFGPEQTQDLISRIIAQSPRPTAFIASGYELALKIRHAVKSHGLSVPEDISLMFFGAPPGPSEISGEVVPIEQMASWTAKSMLDAITRSGEPPQVRTFTSQPQVGNTLASARSREI